MYFGVDYYPEHWPRERWQTDAEMMAAAHINVVRMGEFAWALLELREGKFDFAWLDDAIALLGEHGIATVLGTPTATPPKWLMDQHPEIYPVDLYGLRKGFGTRRHYCASHKVYHRYARRLVEAMAEHYRENPHVIAWQIDNEFDAHCYCDACLAGFREWLKKKYGTIEAVNAAWGTNFWSQTYQSFEQVIIPRYTSSDGFAQVSGGQGIGAPPYTHNPGLLLDYRRYQSDTVVAFQKMQLEILRQYTDRPITHNFMGHFNQLDYFDLGKDLDFVSWDCYPDNMWGRSDQDNIAMAHDLMRGIKNQNFWVMEQQCGPCGWQTLGNTPEPGQVRLWTYQSLAHGAEAIVYFRWRSPLHGTEQYWHGLLDHDGVGRRRYREIAALGKELAGLDDLFVGARNTSQVALIKSYDNAWSHQAQPHSLSFDYNRLLQAYYTGLRAAHAAVDVTSVETDFSHYRLVLMPAFNLMTPAILEKCRVYVEGGGQLLITFRSGTRNWDNSMTTLPAPGYFAELAGVSLEEYDALAPGREVMVQGRTFQGTASIWCDVLSCHGATPLACYASHYYAGAPAVTEHTVGTGKVYYVGCDLDALALQQLLSQVLADARITLDDPAPVPGVEVVWKEKAGRRYMMLLNHRSAKADIPLHGRYTDMLLHRPVQGQLTLKGYDVGILRVDA